MFDKKEVSTYVFKSAYEDAYSREETGKLERDEDGRLVRYEKEDVVAVVENAIKNNTIKKGVKVDNPNSNYITYKYICETKTKNDEKIKYVHRIQVDRKFLEDNLDYINRMEALIVASTKIGHLNLRNKIIQGVAGTLIFASLTVGMGAAFLNAWDKESEAMAAANREYIEQMNEERRENNVAPIGATYKDGTPFQGSYIDWAKYQSGIIDENGNEIVSEEEYDFSNESDGKVR